MQSQVDELCVCRQLQVYPCGFKSTPEHVGVYICVEAGATEGAVSLIQGFRLAILNRDATKSIWKGGLFSNFEWFHACSQIDLCPHTDADLRAARLSEHGNSVFWGTQSLARQDELTASRGFLTNNILSISVLPLLYT